MDPKANISFDAQETPGRDLVGISIDSAAIAMNPQTGMIRLVWTENLDNHVIPRVALAMHIHSFAILVQAGQEMLKRAGYNQPNVPVVEERSHGTKQ